MCDGVSNAESGTTNEGALSLQLQVHDLWMRCFRTTIRAATLLMDGRGDLATQYRDRSFRKDELGLSTSRNDARRRRTIGIRMAVQAVVYPDVLLAPEGHQRDRSNKSLIWPAGALKSYTHAVGIVFIAIHQHE